jgi:hypothetical protein
VLDDGTLSRRDTFLVIGALVLLTVLSGLNSLPSLLALYDTAEPWGRFISGTALRFVVTIAFTLMPPALWLALGAMRRRVGIPMLAGEPSKSASNDMLIAGLGLGGIIFAMTHLDSIVLQGGMPRTPTTVLDQVLPVLAGIADIPAKVLMLVATTGIPLLVVAGLTPRWSIRALMAAAIVALLGLMTWSAAPAGDVDPAMVALLIASTMIVWIAIAVWGTRSAWSWIVAALSYLGLAGLRNAAYGPVWQERGAGALTLLVASALVALIAWRAARPRATEGSLTRI